MGVRPAGRWRVRRWHGPRLLLGVGLAVLGLVTLSAGCAAPSRHSTATTPATTSTATPTRPTPWYLTRGGPKQDQGWAVDVGLDGAVYFGTHQQAPSDLFADMVIYKFSPEGEEVWRTAWGGRFMEKTFVVKAAGDRVLVGGVQYKSASFTDADMAVLSLDAATGKVLWSFTWGQGYGYEEVDGLALDGDDIYVSGWTTGKTTGNDVALLKLTAGGKLQWAQTWGTDGWDEGDGQLAVDADSVYVAGRYDGSGIVSGGKGLLARFSKDSGEVLASETWGGPVFTDALGLCADADHLYAVGLTLDKGKGGQILVRKYDKKLHLVWERVWGGPKSESARSIAVDDAGNVLVAGETSSEGAGKLDIVLLRYSSDGDLQWAKTWGGPEDEGALGLALWGGDVFIAGKTRSFSAGMDDALLISAAAATGELPAPGAPISGG